MGWGAVTSTILHEEARVTGWMGAADASERSAAASPWFRAGDQANASPGSGCPRATPPPPVSDLAVIGRLLHVVVAPSRLFGPVGAHDITFEPARAY